MINLSLKELIIIHINYRDVFNAPIRKDDLVKWITEKPDIESIQRIEFALKELKSEGLIIEKNDLLAVAGKEEVIDLQEEKSRTSQELILKGAKLLNILGKLPFIKFIGISGSVAAKNPTLDKNNHIDLDLFVISSTNSLWIIFLIERVLSNIIRLITKNHFYCFNYVTEETFLEIYNKNFYTASEMVNLMPIVDKGVLHKFIATNQWFELYYSTQSISVEVTKLKKPHFLFNILTPLNYLFFFLFCSLKSLRKFDIKYAFQFTTKFDPTNRGNLKRISTPNGGYQEKIKMKFSTLLASNFPDYMSQQIIDKLFPPESSFDFSKDINLDDLENHKQFEKYA